MPKKDFEDEEDAVLESKPKEEAEIAPSLVGLVKMHKDGKYIHAHPDVVEHHEKKGWKRA
jgi:hypothetical protein